MLRFVQSLPRLAACTFLQYYTPVAPQEFGSLDGKVAIITGGNGGIGFETAMSLATQGCEVYILCRDVTKAQGSVEKIEAECKLHNSKGRVLVLRLDLSDLESVKSCISEIRSLFTEKLIDYFICNAGIMLQPYSESKQGYEIHYATNHLGHFALVGGIIDLLTSSTKTKIVILTGDIAVLANDASPYFKYEGTSLEAYCRSKICNQSFGLELHHRYGHLISVYVVHPGVIDSGLVEKTEGILGTIERIVIRPISMINCRQGAQSTLYCLLTDKIFPGSYFHNVYGVTAFHERASDKPWSDQIWRESIELCKKDHVLILFNE
jgi:NAD(P)-dependent dehydrogenase (short-subunit alcohol dehydrogenase family)